LPLVRSAAATCRSGSAQVRTFVKPMWPNAYCVSGP